MKMKANILIWTSLMGLAALPPSSAESVYPLTAAQVAHALSQAGATVKADDINMMAQVVAQKPDPQLDVLGVQPTASGNSKTGSHQSWVRLGCHEPGICVPFYAVVSWPDTVPAISVQTQAALRHRSLTSADIAIRAGKHAILEIDTSRSRIEIAVVSLENGAVGQTIRVSTPDHKQIYHAEVVSADLVKGGL